ncbi:MAG TPA: LuxR C-terminal-related transcriptional regulator, partial [Syntrophomonadaceae bacterium]|nr:LuxR C-terminal-related transcriptional regulator [Syntrophomonadaceae bacterium]
IVPYFITLAKLKWAEGDISGAFMAICEGEKKLGDGNAYWHYLFDLYTTALYLDMNDIKTARTRLNLTRTGIYDHLSHAREVEHIILAQYLLKSGNLDEAVLLLTRLKNLAEKEDRLGSEVEILCLLALAYQRQGNREKALKALDKALELGMEDGYMRTFIDKVEPMANLLEAYLQGRENSAHTRHIYACQLLAQTQTGQNIKKAVSPTTIELTRRELRVLRLLAEERSNQDIARELNVSVRTVKYHNANLYKKLESKSRIEALIKAREAGLLE